MVDIYNEIPDCTLVTACFCMTKYNKKCRDLAECIDLCDNLLRFPSYLVIYGDKKTVAP